MSAISSVRIRWRRARRRSARAVADAGAVGGRGGARAGQGVDELPAAEAGEAGAHGVGGGGQQGGDLPVGGDAGLHRAAAPGQEHPDLFAGAGAGLGHGQGVGLGQCSAGGGVGVDRIGLAAAALGALGTDDLADRRAGGPQGAGQARPGGAGALDADHPNAPVGADEVVQPVVARRGRRDPHVAQPCAGRRVQDRDVVGVLVGVDPRDDPGLVVGSVPGARPGGVCHHDDAPSSWWARRSGPSRQDVDGALQARIRSCRAPTGAGGSPAGRDADRSRPGQTPGAASQIPGHTPPPDRHLHSPRPNLLQRRSGPGSAVRESAEYQRSSSGAPARSGPLQQIWTNSAPLAPPGRAPSDQFAPRRPRRTPRHRPQSPTGPAPHRTIRPRLRSGWRSGRIHDTLITNV